MKVLEFSLEEGKAAIELNRSEIREISDLMYKECKTGKTRAHFFLLRELLDHGVFDLFDLQYSLNLLTKESEKEFGYEKP